MTALGPNHVKVSNIWGWSVWGTVSGNLVTPQFGWGANVGGGADPPEAELADSWSQSQDGLVWTFKLRDNVFWQDKQPVNARKVTGQDVKWFLDTVRAEGWLAPEMTEISVVDVPDERTVVIKTSKPFPDLLQFLATPLMAMVPKECYEDKKCVEQDTVGFGPFQLQELSLSRLRFVRNPSYHLKYFQGNPLPYLDGFEYVPIADEATYDANWRTGRLDYRLVQDWPTYEAMKKASPDQRLEFTGPVTTIALMGEFVAMYQEKAGPWQDKRVRQALSMAIDRKRVCDVTTGGYCVVQSSINAARDLGRPIEFSMEEMANISPNFQYNPEQAKKLLTEAGYADGFTLDVMTGRATKGMGAVERWLEVFKDWEKIGVKVRHDANQEAGAAQTKRAYPGVLGGSTTLSGVRAYQQAYSLLHSKGAVNYFGLKDRKLDQMLDEWRFLPVGSKQRREVSVEIFNYINDEMYRINVWANMKFETYQPWVMNMICGTDSCERLSVRAYSRTWLDPTVKGFPGNRGLEPRSKP